MINCCELPAKLPSFPYTWQNELSNLLCEILETRQNIDCQTVKDCETVTSFNSFNLNGTTLSMSYTDEKGVITPRQVDLSSVNANPYIFNNGLTKNTDLVQLGGDLIKPTIIGGTNETVNTLWIKNNTSVGTGNPRQDSSLITGRTKLTTSEFNFGTYSFLNNFSAITPLDGINAGTYLSNNLYLTSGPTTYTITDGTYETGLYASINVLNGSNKNITGKIAAITTSGVFNHDVIETGGGTISDFIGIRITAPTQLEPTVGYASKDFTGTITDTYGVFVESQRGRLRNTATQTNTWGVYQAGADDLNYFRGKLVTGIENASADSLHHFRSAIYGKLEDSNISAQLYKAHTTSDVDNPTRTTRYISAGSESLLSSNNNLFGLPGDIIAGSLHGFYVIGTQSVQNPTIKGFTSAAISSNVLSGEQILKTPSNPNPTPLNNSGTVEKLIGFLAKAPLQVQSTSQIASGLFTGTISDTYAFYAEPQTGGLNVGATQTRTWGVYQAGADDRNYFAGRMRLNTARIPTFNNDTDAGSGGLIAGDIYKKTSGELMIKL